MTLSKFKICFVYNFSLSAARSRVASLETEFDFSAKTADDAVEYKVVILGLGKFDKKWKETVSLVKKLKKCNF